MHQYDPELDEHSRRDKSDQYFNGLDVQIAIFGDEVKQNACPKLDVNLFRVVSCVGQGSIGAAYKAEKDLEFYVIKRMEKAQIRSRNMMKHAINEKIYTYAMQDSPFVVKLLGSFKDRESLYLIMECAEYGDLNVFLAFHEYRVPEDRLRQVIVQVALGLQFMHACGVMNRDLKPSNILVCTGGRVKLADLGLAFDLFEDPRPGYGSYFYKAPEAILGESYNEAVDWWALGIVTYKLLCDQHPFFEDGERVTSEKMHPTIMDRSVDFGRHELEYISDECKDFILRLLEKNPSERIGTERRGEKAIQNQAWFVGVSWYDVLFNPTLFHPDFLNLKAAAENGETPTETEYPFKRYLPDAEDPQRNEFKDF